MESEKSLSNLCRVPKLSYAELTQEMLKEHLTYNKATGEVHVIKTNSPRFRNRLPMLIPVRPNGEYTPLMVCGIRLPLHVIAVVYVTGKHPDRSKLEVVDHINGDTSDNRWENLRVISGGENVRNQSQTKNTTKSGVTGVYKKGSRYMAHIRVDKVLHNLGTYETLDEAVAARVAALKFYSNVVENSLTKSTLQNLI